jgi:hypothetical protein
MIGAVSSCGCWELVLNVTLSLLFQADLYAGAVFIEQSLKWNLYGSVMLLLAIAAVFTITGKWSLNIG